MPFRLSTVILTALLFIIPGGTAVQIPQKTRGIIEGLQDYSKEDQLVPSLLFFTKKALKKEIRKEQLQYPRKNKKLYGNALISVIDEDGMPQFVIKVIKVSSKRRADTFVRELSGYALSSSYSWGNLLSAPILGLGKCTLPQGEFAFIAIELAAGREVNYYLSRVCCIPISHPMRSELFKTALDSVKNLGAALSKVHKIKKREAFLSSQVKRTFNNIFYRALKQLKASPDWGVNLRGLEERYTRLLQEMERVPHHISLTHGDTHLHNFFYDPIHEKITMIDFLTTYYAIDDSGESVGVAAWDYMRTFEAIRHKGLEGLSEKEVDMLQSSFRKAYGMPLSELEMEFFTLFIRTQHVLWYASTVEKGPGQPDCRHKRLIADLLYF